MKEAEDRKRAPPSSAKRSPPQPSSPPAKNFKLDADFYAEKVKVDRKVLANPSLSKGDPYGHIEALVAKKHGVSVDQLFEARTAVQFYRNHLEEKAKANAGKNVIGSVKVGGVDRSDLGVHTARLAVTVTRCPEGPPERDKDIQFLAGEALKQIAQNLPTEIDSYRATIWYRGLACSRGSAGYGARWTRESGAVTLE